MSDWEATLLCKGCGKPIAIIVEGMLIPIINMLDAGVPCPACEIALEQAIIDFFEGEL